MLQLMLESHSRIAGLPEPNLLPPLQYLGYYGGFQTGTVYEPVNQAQGLKEFADYLGGEALYIDACRNYAQTYYQKALESKKGAQYFLDKTPSNVLIWPLLVKMFPAAHYVILTRHPYAIIHSYAKSFFTGDFSKMKQENTRIPEHIRAVSEVLRADCVLSHTVRYEDLVEQPESSVRKILNFLELNFEPAVIHYGSVPHRLGTMGDPLTALKEKQPQKNYAHLWTASYKRDPSLVGYSDDLLKCLSDDDFTVYGYPKQTLLNPLSDQGVSSMSPPPQNTAAGYHLQRKVFFKLKQWSGGGLFRKMIERIRYYCDVLLRQLKTSRVCPVTIFF